MKFRGFHYGSERVSEGLRWFSSRFRWVSADFQRDFETFQSRFKGISEGCQVWGGAYQKDPSKVLKVL